MNDAFLIYGATGYVGAGAARHAVSQGLRPILAGRDPAGVRALADELGLESRVFSLADPGAIESGLDGVGVVLHLAGPFLHTYAPMLAACLRVGAHYLDINGEIPVLQAIHARDADARAAGILLMPAVGFDVVPTDSLALHLHRRLPGGTGLALAFRNIGPAGLPPGTQRTMIELLPYPGYVRRDGRLVEEEPAGTRDFDFGEGPVEATRLTWGDAFTAFHTTGIPNVENYIVMPAAVRMQMRLIRRLRRVLAPAPVRAALGRFTMRAPTPAERAETRTQVLGELTDDAGRSVRAMLEGPEAGLEWTALSALSVVRRVLAGDAPAGFHTPAGAYGPDLVLDVEGVVREDVE